METATMKISIAAINQGKKKKKKFQMYNPLPVLYPKNKRIDNQKLN